MILEPSVCETSTESVEGHADRAVIYDLGTFTPRSIKSPNKRQQQQQQQQQPKMVKKQGPGTPRQHPKKPVQVGRSSSAQRAPRSSSTGRAMSGGTAPKCSSSHELRSSPVKKQKARRKASLSPVRTRKPLQDESPPPPSPSSP